MVSDEKLLDSLKKYHELEHISIDCGICKSQVRIRLTKLKLENKVRCIYYKNLTSRFGWHWYLIDDFSEDWKIKRMR